MKSQSERVGPLEKCKCISNRIESVLYNTSIALCITRHAVIFIRATFRSLHDVQFYLRSLPAADDVCVLLVGAG